MAASNSYSNGIKIGLTEELAVDDYYKAKLSSVTSKPKAKSKSRIQKNKSRPARDLDSVAFNANDAAVDAQVIQSTPAITEDCSRESDACRASLANREEPSLETNRTVEAALRKPVISGDGLANSSAPSTFSFSSGASHIVESRWRNTSSAPRDVKDPLGDLLAAQERVLQERRLDLQEALEARETFHSNRESGLRSRRATAPPASRAAAAVEQKLGSLENRGFDVGPNCFMDENAAKVRPARDKENLQAQVHASQTSLTRTCDLTLVLAGDLLDELARGYSQAWFQELVQQCASDCRDDRLEFALKLHGIAFEVQKPILENWGFDGNIQGVYDMTSIIREFSGANGEHVPQWFAEKRDACLKLLYGGERSGMFS